MCESVGGVGVEEAADVAQIELKTMCRVGHTAGLHELTATL